MKNLIGMLLAFMALMSSEAWAGRASASAAAFAKGPSGYVAVPGKGAQAANGAYNTSASVNMAGTQVQVPASARYAANAASFAVGAVRFNPALAVGSIALWLAGMGLEYAVDHWNKNRLEANVTNLRWYINSNGSATKYATRDAAFVAMGGSTYYYMSWANNSWNVHSKSNGVIVNYINPICLAGGGNLVSVGGGEFSCGPAVNVAYPATEADFVAAGAGVVPDNVAQQLYDAGQPVPIQAPSLNPAPIDAPLGNPYVDPVTGKTVQPKVRITPDPTADDPFSVQVNPYNVEVAPAPAPAPGDPVPVPKDEQPKDPCLEYPSRVGCLDAGTPEDSTLGTKAVPMVLTPVSVGGAGSCPANKTFNAMGKQMTFSYAPICTGATLMKPIVLALAWLLAAYIIVGTMKDA